MEVRWKLLIGIALLAATVPVFAGGNKEAPVVSDYPKEPAYLSPNGDNVQDNAKIDFTVRLRIKSKKGYVPTYGLRIKRGDAIVRDVRNSSEKPDIGWFMRLFTGYTEFTLTRSIEWDGKDDEGKVAADADYQGTLYVIDANRNETEIKVGDFVLDNTPPRATVSAESLFFSPNNDGHKDTLLIRQSGSSEDLWNGTVLDASGNAVRTFTWKSGPPVDQEWDGRTDSGGVAPDGTYSYVLESTDRAGNKTRIDSLRNVVLDTRPTPVRIAVDPPYFSPNGDKVKDTTTLTLSTDIKDGIVGWKVAVLDPGKREVWARQETSDKAPDAIVFDGRDSAGTVLPDGVYTVTYQVTYRNGNAPDTSASVNLDNTPPVASLEIDNPIFSPVGRKKTATIRLVANERVTGQGRFLDAGGRVLAESAPGQTTSEIVWDGTDLAGNRLPDGVYGIDVTVTDLAGNTTRVPPARITIDTVPPKVDVAVDNTIFSPNGDGVRDTVTVTVRTDKPVSGTLTAAEPSGGRIGPLDLRRFGGEVSQVWDGTGPNGQPLPDGTYQVRAAFEDDAGNETDVGPVAVTLDRRAGRIAVDVPDGFSPAVGKLTARVNAEVYDGVDAWKLVIQDSTKRTVKTFTGSNPLPKEVTWDGRTDAGSPAAEGKYTASLEASYRNGNRAAADSNPFQVDVTPPQVSLAVASDPFVRTDGTLQGEAFATLNVKDASPIGKWSLDLLDQKGEVVRTYNGTGDPSGNLVWKGEFTASGAPSRDYQGNPTEYRENYTVRMVVADEFGNSTTYRGPVPIDVIILRKDNKMFLLVPNIIFGAYRHELDSRGPEFYKRNMDSIKRVADLAKRYPDYGIGLEAHAENIYLGQAREKQEEQILFPLTQRRAESVRKALVDLGVAPARITSNAYGGKFPLADVRDPQVYWKNRRVEFILVPKK
jgi:flagellar hook assembly protein FlgD/outer membrane protein OmpA-like peptidoglycan-associated protein